MSEFYGFENLECWKQAKDLAVEMYKLSDNGNFRDDKAMLDDLKRSAVSVASLIAGGREKGGASNFVHSLGKAKATAAELKTRLIIFREIGYLGEGDYLDFDDRINRVSAMLGGLIRAIQNKKGGQRKKQPQEGGKVSKKPPLSEKSGQK
ncbi:MAG: four helix bundle protein [Candidatus Aminicenantes bacterium]|nr:four helix bundle protein [Candidatus Aminicenantes bacterium]